MFIVHQIVNVLINPVLDVLVLFALGVGLVCFGRKRLGRGVCTLSGIALFLMSWPPFVDVLGIWLEKDYPVAKVESCPAEDAIIVLGGGVVAMPPEIDYPYPLMSDAADRVWHGARLWHAFNAKNPDKMVRLYCTGPDVSLTTPPLLRDLGIPGDCIVAVDGPLNTEEEARKMEELLSRNVREERDGRAKVLLVTSATHMKRATRIFEKYAPSLETIPFATDHHFVADPVRFKRWQYWFPSLDAFIGFSVIEHELIGLLRYAW